MNSKPTVSGQDFYTTRPFNKNINVFKEPVQILAVAADIGHRIFKVGSDVLRVLQGKNREPLADLTSSSIVRTKEATVGAVRNVFNGMGNILTGKFVSGAAKITQGVFDVFDIIPSAVADSVHAVTGVNKTRAAVHNTLSTQSPTNPIAKINRPTVAHAKNKHLAPTLSL